MYTKLVLRRIEIYVSLGGHFHEKLRKYFFCNSLEYLLERYFAFEEAPCYSIFLPLRE